MSQDFKSSNNIRFIMKNTTRKVAGFLFLVGGVQGVLGIIIAEACFPGYSTSENYISDLGVGPSALVFNSSLCILGMLGIVGAYLIQQALHIRLFPLVLGIASLGVVGVGLFPENFGKIHFVFSLITFLFAGLSAILSSKLENPPLSYFSAFLGILALTALVLFGSGTYLGLGRGGMERMIAYPALLWVISFGSFLITKK